jgi:hypothetical protein
VVVDEAVVDEMEIVVDDVEVVLSFAGTTVVEGVRAAGALGVVDGVVGCFALLP